MAKTALDKFKLSELPGKLLSAWKDLGQTQETWTKCALDVRWIAAVHATVNFAKQECRMSHQDTFLFPGESGVDVDDMEAAARADIMQQNQTVLLMKLSTTSMFLLNVILCAHTCNMLMECCLLCQQP